MQLLQLDPKKIAEMTAIAQAKEMLKALGGWDRDAIWLEEYQVKAQAFLSESGYQGRYDYRDLHAINVSACWRSRDGFEGNQLVVIFWAKYSGADMDLIIDCLADNHWVQYWVESDGALTWASDKYAKKGDFNVPNNNKGIQGRKVNPDWQRGCRKGQQQRRKDTAIGVYPRSGLPVSDGNPDKVEVVVRVDRATFNAAQNIDKSQWAELGWRIAASGLDQALIDRWVDDRGYSRAAIHRHYTV